MGSEKLFHRLWRFAARVRRGLGELAERHSRRHCRAVGRMRSSLSKVLRRIAKDRFPMLDARFAERPIHLVRGRRGEAAAKRYLQSRGLKFLTANFASKRGEIDLIFRDQSCLVFVEVKTRSSEAWTRPAAAVNARKRRLLSLTAFDYLRLLKHPRVPIRFDVVEVLLDDDEVSEIRHLPNTFSLSPPYRYG